MIKTCKCSHPYQDKKHGQNKRVHNENAKGDYAKCTSCGKEKQIKGAK